MAAIKARVNEQGRLVIPAEIREAAGIAPNSTVLIEAMGVGEIRVRSAKAALAKVRARLRRFAGPEIVDELIAERRKEAKRE